MRNSLHLLLITWGLVCLAIIFGGLAVTLAPGEMTWAWPVPGGLDAAVGLTRNLALVVAVLAGLCLVLAVNIAKADHRARPWAELVLYYALVFGAVWWVLGPGRPEPRHGIVIGVLLIGAVGLKWSLRPPRPAAPSWRTWLTADILLILAPVLAGLWLGNQPDGPSIWRSLLLYPAYAAVQLLVFLVIPMDRLQALATSARISALACAGLFALIHWPNPLLMVLTLGAMGVWSRQYRRGRSLWQLALVMGLAATTVSQFLPDDLTRHMRVGPGYIRQETVLAAAGEPGTGRGVPLAEFLARIYPAAVGRPPAAQEISNWAVTLDQALRPVTAWRFFISGEYDRLARRRGLTPSPPVDQPWTSLDAVWQERITRLADTGAHLPWPAYIDFLYEAVLDRAAAPGEGQSWTRDLNWSQRKRVTEVLLDWRLTVGAEESVRITPARLNLLQ